MNKIESQLDDAELRSMVIDAINATADAQVGPVKSATKAADALLIAAAIMIEANPRFVGEMGMESALTTASMDIEVYLNAMRKYSAENHQGMLSALSDWGIPN